MEQDPKKKPFLDRHPFFCRIFITVALTLILFAICFTVYWIKKDDVSYSAGSWIAFGIGFIAFVVLIWRTSDNPKE